MTHDPLCPSVETPIHLTDLDIYYDRYRCECVLIAEVRADERAKYSDETEPERGEEHVDWCRDLYCYGCQEIK
jgi:hypothetical protein